jgi:non-canonical purine NTP pyrophosphatase (RdgB/HAM1 family)
MKKITFITGNKAKAELLARHLKIEVDHKKLDIDEIQSLDLNEVVTKKAKSAYKILKSPVLVEDVSLIFNALGHLPGPLIKWFLEELDNSGLCRLINHYNKDRSAVARVAFCYYDGKESKVFDAEIKGKIAAHPRGEKGFGWDPIFIPDGYEQTWAEMDEKDAGASSMRKVALEKFEKYLGSNSDAK